MVYYLRQENEEHAASLAEETHPRAFGSPMEKNIGHFLLHALLTELNVKETIDILASQMRFQFSVYDMMAQLIYSHVICPCSKSKTVSSVFPHLYSSVSISEDQVYDGCSFIGGSYKKYIELFNHCYEQHFKRDFTNVFFDCTNYHFEIDLPSEDRQKGPSKENRHGPIIGQALLLDADLIPAAMQMYPGNEAVTSFSVKEKRIVSYNPALARKQKAEIMKMADKAANYTTYKKMAREKLGDSTKYIKITSRDKNGKKIAPVIEIVLMVSYSPPTDLPVFATPITIYSRINQSIRQS